MKKILVIAAVLYSAAAIAQTSEPPKQPMVGGKPLVQVKPKGTKSKDAQPADGAQDASKSAKAAPGKPKSMGEDIPALKIFARRSSSGAPAYAILFQVAVASLMLLTRSFEAVLEFIQFSLLFCSFFAVLGVIVLRFTRPDLPRPYRAWGYPFSPLVFLLVTGFMMYYLLTTQPKPSLLGVLIMISGLLIYAIFRKQPGDGHAAAPVGRE